jgi:hypothetical protein
VPNPNIAIRVQLFRRCIEPAPLAPWSGRLGVKIAKGINLTNLKPMKSNGLVKVNGISMMLNSCVLGGAHAREGVLCDKSTRPPKVNGGVGWRKKEWGARLERCSPPILEIKPAHLLLHWGRVAGSACTVNLYPNPNPNRAPSPS